MIIPDVNLLIYATDESSPFHPRAKTWWEGRLAGREAVGMPWAVCLGFVRLATSPKLFERPLTPAEATGIVADWLSAPPVQIIEPGPRHWTILSGLLEEVGVGAKLVPDAHLAALAIEHRALLCTNDRDLERFSGVKLQNPVD